LSQTLALQERQSRASAFYTQCEYYRLSVQLVNNWYISRISSRQIYCHFYYLLAIAALREAQSRRAYVLLVFYFFIFFIDLCLTNYVNIYRADLHEICTVRVNQSTLGVTGSTCSAHFSSVPCAVNEAVCLIIPPSSLVLHFVRHLPAVVVIFTVIVARHAVLHVT